jgi:hypothetical protein
MSCRTAKPDFHCSLLPDFKENVESRVAKFRFKDGKYDNYSLNDTKMVKYYRLSIALEAKRKDSKCN